MEKIKYCCPFCGHKLEAAKPNPGQTFDSFVKCPACNELHVKIVSHRIMEIRWFVK